MPGWQVAVIVLVAVFVGMWIPVSLQLSATLRAGQKFLETIGTRGGRTLVELTDTVSGLNRTLNGVGELAQSASQLKDSMRLISSIGAAVGPAIIAAVRAWRAPEPDSFDGDGAGTTRAGIPVETGAAPAEDKEGNHEA